MLNPQNIVDCFLILLCREADLILSSNLWIRGRRKNAARSCRSSAARTPSRSWRCGESFTDWAIGFDCMDRSFQVVRTLYSRECARSSSSTAVFGMATTDARRLVRRSRGRLIGTRSSKRTSNATREISPTSNRWAGRPWSFGNANLKELKS